VGIGVGIGAAAIGILSALIVVCRRKVRRHSVPIFQGNQEIWPRNTSMHPAEMSSNALHELAQLETREHPIELPAKREYLYEIGRAF
jgi:peptide deformylase